MRTVPALLQAMSHVDEATALVDAQMRAQAFTAPTESGAAAKRMLVNLLDSVMGEGNQQF